MDNAVVAPGHPHPRDFPLQPQCDLSQQSIGRRPACGFEFDETSREQPHEEDNNDSQETFTQMTQGNELTQLGVDDEDDAAAMSQSDDCHSPMPLDPRTLPWGRLMPVGSNDSDVNPPPGDHGGRPGSARGATEMLPRSPGRAGPIATRRRSPSDSGHSNGWSPPCINFLGLKNLLPSDRFNEYVLGRSVKADVTALKLVESPQAAAATQIPSEAAEVDAQRTAQRDSKRKRHDYVHAMVSNRHCRVYCLLSPAGAGNVDPSAPPEMEVFVEDTSGNGTLVNGTTLLRRNERRRLHTGDVVCLLNPRLLAKKLRSAAERKRYMSQYSYVFVNLYEQEARHGWGALGDSNSAGAQGKTVGGRGDRGSVQLASPVSTSKSKGAVNARATRCHSPHNQKSKRSLFASSMDGIGDCRTAAQPQQCSSNHNSATNRRLGSFLTNSKRPQSQPLGASNLPSSKLPRPRRIEDEYDLRDLLGTGTCGEVRRAIHRHTGEERAVKIISIASRGGGRAVSAEKLAVVRAEAKMLRGLDHPYVVRLHEVFVAEGRAVYLVTELVRGGDLFDRIVERVRYAESTARRLFRRVLAAVHYLHEEMGIVHRDLKPENILVVDRRSDVNVKLTDFGLAKNLTPDGLKTFCGTPQYFAPEVLRRRHTVTGVGRYGKEIDCWSLGVILFVLLSGAPPFDASMGIEAVANAQVVFCENAWQGVSGAARDLVMRLLERDPAKRASVEEACQHEWVLVKDGDTHCHPLHDPTIAGRDMAKDKDSADKNRNEAPSKPKDSSNHDHSNAAKSTHNKLTGSLERDQSNAVRSSHNNRDAKIGNSVCDQGNVARTASNSEETPIKPVPPLGAKTPGSTQSKNNETHHHREKFQSMSAPPQISQDRRQPSVWPAHPNDKIVTKVIQQGCHPFSNGSPIQKRQLFETSINNNRNRGATARKMTKRGLEAVMTAGDTLPEPVLRSEASRLVKKVVAPRKKVQSTLFPSSEVAGCQRGEKSKHAVPQKEDRGKDARKLKPWTNTMSRRDHDHSSTVTPPGYGQDPPSRLHEKLKAEACSDGNYISPTMNDANATAVAAALVKRTELSEDELQSDFSDDEGRSLVTAEQQSSRSGKKPLERFLRKRKIESIDSSASGSNLLHNKPQEKAEEVLQSMPKKTCEPKGYPHDFGKADQKHCATAVAAVGNQTKKTKVQSFLFGMPPPNLECNKTEAPPAVTSNDGSAELRRQASGESGGSGSIPADSKVKQRSLRTWFQPKQ